MIDLLYAGPRFLGWHRHAALVTGRCSFPGIFQSYHPIPLIRNKVHTVFGTESVGLSLSHDTLDRPAAPLVI
jgi:hypothetical protein